MTLDIVRSEYKKQLDSWVNCANDENRRDFLFNGFLLDIYDIITSKNLVQRVAALKDIMIWRQDNDAALLLFDDYGKLPDASCAVYDLADRVNTKEFALKKCIRRLVDNVNPLDIYIPSVLYPRS